MQVGKVAAANAVFFLCQHHDGAAFGRLVGERRQLRSVGQFVLADAAHRQKFRGLPVAERDGAGLVEQESVDVARGFDRAARHGKDVEAHQPVHSGDADGRQKRADGGGNQGDEQRHQDDDGNGAAGISDVARDRRGGEHEDDGQADQENVERDLVRSFLPLGAFDEPDHAVEERGARRRGDAHAYPVGQHLRAAGDGRAVAAGFANDRRRFTGDGGFVDRSHALDHLAVGRDDVAGFDQDDVVDLEFGRGDEAVALRIAVAAYQLGPGFGPLPPQRFGLGLAAAFGDRLGEVGEQHGEPQPEDDLKFEDNIAAAGHEVADQDDGGERGDDFEHKHHRVLHQRARIELDES